MFHSLSVPPQKDINIAFIDDEPRVLRTLKMQFKRQYTVFTATDPDEFLEIIRTHTIHVAISDQRMPKMNGVDVLKQVKNLSPNTVRLLLTGYADISAIVASLNQGEIYRYLTKPWKTHELNDTLASAVAYAKTLMAVDVPDVSAPVSSQTSGQILLVDAAGALHAQLEAQLANQYQFVKYSSLSDAVSVLEQQMADHVAHGYQVMMVDLDTVFDQASSDTQRDQEQLLITLQQNCPELVVVALTSQQDSQRLITLINSRAVYRCLPKPISPAVLQANISQAFARHHALKAEPKLIFR